MAKKINLAALNFLIASNNAQERQAAKGILHTLGARNIRLVPDGSEAIAEMKRFLADVVFCEWDMSPVNGLQFTQHIRAEGKGIGQFAVIIALCGKLSQQLVVKARDVGVNDFIAKPMSIGSVTSRLHRIFNNPKDFARSDAYFGPDRRCRDAAFEGEEQRQTPAKKYPHPLIAKFANVFPEKPKPKVTKAPQPRPVEPPPAEEAPRPAAPMAPRLQPMSSPPAPAAVRGDIHPAMSQGHLLAALGASAVPPRRPIEAQRELPPAMTQDHLLATLLPPGSAVDSVARPVAETQGDRPATITQDDLMAAFRALLSSSLHQNMP